VEHEIRPEKGQRGQLQRAADSGTAQERGVLKGLADPAMVPQPMKDRDAAHPRSGGLRAQLPEAAC